MTTNPTFGAETTGTEVASVFSSHIQGKTGSFATLIHKTK